MDKVWQLIYDSFEKMPMAGLRTSLGTNGMRNEIQFELQRSIAEYKSTPSIEKLDSIAGAVRTANATGFVSDETFNKIMNILDKEGM